MKSKTRSRVLYVVFLVVMVSAALLWLKYKDRVEITKQVRFSEIRPQLGRVWVEERLYFWHEFGEITDYKFFLRVGNYETEVSTRTNWLEISPDSKYIAVSTYDSLIIFSSENLEKVAEKRDIDRVYHKAWTRDSGEVQYITDKPGFSYGENLKTLTISGVIREISDDYPIKLADRQHLVALEEVPSGIVYVVENLHHNIWATIRYDKNGREISRTPLPKAK